MSDSPYVCVFCGSHVRDGDGGFCNQFLWGLRGDYGEGPCWIEGADERNRLGNDMARVYKLYPSANEVPDE